jgi:hypothetical protein
LQAKSLEGFFSFFFACPVNYQATIKVVYFVLDNPRQQTFG